LIQVVQHPIVETESMRLPETLGHSFPFRRPFDRTPREKSRYMKSVLPLFLFIVVLSLLSVFYQPSVRGQTPDQFFLNTNTETYTYLFAGNHNQGDPEASYQYVTRELTNSLLPTRDDVWFGHISVTARASFGSLFLAENAESQGNIYDAACQCYEFYDGYTYPSPSGAAWGDRLMISNPLLNGTTGYLRVNILVSGSLYAAMEGDNFNGGGEAEARWSFQFGNQNEVFGASSFNASGYCLVEHASPPPYETFNQASNVTMYMGPSVLASSNGVAHLDLPFVYGQTFYLYCHLGMDASSSGGYDLNFSTRKQAAVQVQWQGATVLDANSNVMANFTLTSESGTDWTASQPVVPGILQISGINALDATNLVINGTGGASSNHVYLLTSTNLALPMTNWTCLNTNIFDNVGHVSTTNGIIPGEQPRYFRLLSP
jgi:hypothetical protein